MQTLDNKLEMYVSNYISENGKKINGVSKTREEIKEWILNRDNCIYHGALHKLGNKIVDENNIPVEIRGIGTHHLLEYRERLHTKQGSETLKLYGVNCLRLSAYLKSKVNIKSNGERTLGYLDAVDETRKSMDELIEICKELGLYVIVDWHILGSDGLCNQYLTEQKEFFEYFSNKYADCPNVIYEIANEPYGKNETLDTYIPTVKACYDIIRSHNSTAIIVTHVKGTDDEFKTALEENNMSDIFYSIHSYIGKSTLSPSEAKGQVKAGFITGKRPYFKTEWGNSEDTGDGVRNDELAKAYLDTYHEYCYPHCFWKWSNQDMTTSIIKYSDAGWYDNMYKDGGWTYEDLSENGKLFLSAFQEYAFGDSHITREPITE